MLACGCVSDYLSSINCVGALASVYFVCVYYDVCVGKICISLQWSVCSCITFRYASACNFAHWGVYVQERMCVNTYINLNLYMHIFVQFHP